MTPKTMTQDVWIEINDKRYCIPKGFTIKARYEYMSKYGLNENWKFNKMENGNILDLNNWIEITEDGEKKFVMNKSFVTFGIGRRDCPGRQLAEKQIQTIMGYILMNYQLSLQDKDIDIVNKSLGDSGSIAVQMNSVEPPIDVVVTPIG